MKSAEPAAASEQADARAAFEDNSRVISPIAHLTAAQAASIVLKLKSSRNDAQARTMTTESSSPTAGRPPQKVKWPPPPSRNMAAFGTSWLLGWPLLVFADNPLAAPYEPLTLLLVVPGGAIWFYLFIYFYAYFYEKLFTWAEARWRVAKTIRKILEVIPELIMYMLCFLP